MYRVEYSKEHVEHSMGVGPKFFYPKVDGEYISISWYEAKILSSSKSTEEPVQFIDYEDIGKKASQKNNRNIEYKIYGRIINSLTNIKENDESKYYDKYGTIGESRVRSSNFGNGEWTKSLIKKWYKNWKLHIPKEVEPFFKVRTSFEDNKCKIKIYKSPSSYWEYFKQKIFGESFLEIDINREYCKIIDGGKIRTGPGGVISLDKGNIEMSNEENKIDIHTYSGESELGGNLSNSGIRPKEEIGKTKIYEG